MFWQPLLGALVLGGGILYINATAGRASDARDARLLKEAELRAAQADRLAGKASTEEEVKALTAEVERLRAAERAAAELIGFGEDTATSRRWSLSLPPPPSEISRRFAAAAATRRGAADAEAQTPDGEGQESEALEIVGLLVGISLLAWFLFAISG